MKLQLNDFPEINVLPELKQAGNNNYRDPEGLINRVADFPKDTRWANGWEKAGGESYMREVHVTSGSEPDFIQKSGNPRKTIERGGKLAHEGANVIPTLMIVNQDALRSGRRVNGNEYCIFQRWARGPELEENYEDSASFADQYENNNLGERAVRQLGENAAVIDNLGYGIKDPERMVNEMLTDREHCYIADFGDDLGTSGYEPHRKMYNAGTEFLDKEDQDLFDEVYEKTRDETSPAEETSFGPEALLV